MIEQTAFDGMVIEPKIPAQHSIIWLHGLGADATDWVPVVEQLALPETLAVRFIFPNAPVQPVTINAGTPARSWFDITSLSDFAQLDHKDISQSRSAIHNLIDNEIASGVKAENILLAGFSQGGALALYCGLTCRYRLAGVLALSTFFISPEQVGEPLSAVNKHTSILMMHGLHDDVVALPLAEGSFEMLKNLHYPIEFKTYSMAHQACAQQIQDMRHWLLERFTSG